MLASRRLSRVIALAFPGGVPSRAGRIWIRDAAVNPVTAGELLFRLYERHELALIRQTMLKGYDVVELGAGIGVTGSVTAKRLDGAGRLICLEANPALLPVLKRNLERHRGSTEVVVVHGALAYADEAVAFVPSAVHLSSRIGAAESEGTEVPTFTLADIVRDYQVGDFVLVSDIEGAERAMIAEDSGALRRCRQLIIELHGTQAQIAMMVEQLSGLGFRVVAARKAILSLVRT
jgi:FkbM family methyltransferase